MRASMRFAILISVLALPAVVTACTDSPLSASATPGFSQTDLRTGSGAEATTGKTVEVNYTGWLYDPSQPDQKGLPFDSSVGKSTFSFTLGAGQVIKGWDNGVPGMKVGGLRRLVIPPSLGYGMTRAGVIPPNATLVFDIELLNVQ
jgi:FKBP-type peptidyl-prolyl cis-trans isomerase FkpA